MCWMRLRQVSITNNRESFLNLPYRLYKTKISTYLKMFNSNCFYLSVFLFLSPHFFLVSFAGFDQSSLLQSLSLFGCVLFFLLFKLGFIEFLLVNNSVNSTKLSFCTGQIPSAQCLNADNACSS